MSNSYFQFKQFTIHQDKCAMKVGTDGVLLGAWANCKTAQKILDIGTGTGLIALMLAQRSCATIQGIEIDKAAYEQAKENVASSIWSERINIRHTSFQDFYKSQSTKYDLIISNPPYFKNSQKSPNIERNTARHADKLTSKDILIGSKKLLTENGKLYLILPIDEGIKLIDKAKQNGWHCQQETTVIPRTGAIGKRLLLCFGFDNKKCEKSELVIETNGRHIYSKEYIEITKDYYLKL